MPVGNVENLNKLASELGCRVGSLPSTYLGHPLGSKLNEISVWDGIEKNSEKGSPLGRDSIYRKGEDLRSSKVRYPICIFTSSPCSGCLRVSKASWKKSK